LTSVKRPQSGNSGLISDLRSKTSLLEQPLQKWSPAKHLFVTQSSQPKSGLSALNLDWLSSAVIPARGGTAARSRNSWGTPRGYPFKLKAAAASPLVAKECAAPVVCRLASGADAPKSVHSVLRLCRCAASRGRLRALRLAPPAAKLPMAPHKTATDRSSQSNPTDSWRAQHRSGVLGAPIV
jgi:hypothetical protein